MGWLALCRRTEQYPTLTLPNKAEKGPYSEHEEDISGPTKQPYPFLNQIYPIQSPSLSDSDLPYIDPSILSLVEDYWRKSNQSQTADRKLPASAPNSNNQPPAWLVIDNIVYDCTDFQTTHPGGSVVIRSFVGQDCSWQFWRFHSKTQMRDVGRHLRIGRTSGVMNRFEEPKRYVGVGVGFDDEVEYEW